MLADVRILFVEDSVDEAEIYRLGLEPFGASVVCVGSVWEALDAVGRGLVDIVVSDLFLPGRGGLELVHELRATGVTAPAVALAGVDARLLGPAARAAGFDVYCAKPCLPTELATAIAILHRRARAGSGANFDTVGEFAIRMMFGDCGMCLQHLRVAPEPVSNSPTVSNFEVW
jgi:DNA-binding response OmpR family regulator